MRPPRYQRILVGLLFDTSAIIGLRERGSTVIRQVVLDSGTAPRISVISLGELETGVRMASAEATRARLGAQANANELSIRLFQREATLNEVTREHLLPVDERTAQSFGLMRSKLPRSVLHNDCWIAALAHQHQLELVTEDLDLADRLSTDTTLGVIIHRCQQTI